MSDMNVREARRELAAILREVSTWRDRLTTVFGLAQQAETDGEMTAAAGLARRLKEHMGKGAQRVQAFARRLETLAEQLDQQAAAASEGDNRLREKE